MLTAHHHFPAASTSNPGSPTFPHSQSLSLNGAGFALALRPGTSVGHRPSEREGSIPFTASLPEDPEASAGSGRTYLDFVKSWDDEHVARWLGEVNVGQYRDTFQKNDIRGNVLLDVDQSALKEMGVRSVGDRVKISVAIKALRQKCASSVRSERLLSRAATSLLNSSRGVGGSPTAAGGVGSAPAPAGMANGIRRAGSGRGGGRIPPPLHLTQSNSVPTANLPQAWQPSSTPSARPSWGSQSGYTTLLNTSVNGGSTSPRATGSPRSAHPPALPPPSSRPPPPPQGRRPSTSPPNSTMSPPRTAAPSISTTAASPTNSYTGGPIASNWTGEYGLPRGPAPGNLAAGAYTSRTSSVSPAANDRIRAPGVAPPNRPATSSSAQLHRKSSSGGNAPRPSTAQAAYGHNTPLSSHPYATASSPTQDGFSVTTYGRGSPNLAAPVSTSSSKLLPSPSIGQPALSPVSEGSDGPRSGSSGSTSTGAGGSALSSPTALGGYRSYPRSNSTTATSLPSASSASSLDAVMRKAVKFISEDGGSKMVAVADCSDGHDVLLRVLRKFQKLGGGAEGDEVQGWGVYSMSSDGQSESCGL